MTYLQFKRGENRARVFVCLTELYRCPECHRMLFSGLLQDPWRRALGSLTPTQSGGELSATREQGGANVKPRQ